MIPFRIIAEIQASPGYSEGSEPVQITLYKAYNNPVQFQMYRGEWEQFKSYLGRGIHITETKKVRDASTVKAD